MSAPAAAARVRVWARLGNGDLMLVAAASIGLAAAGTHGRYGAGALAFVTVATGVAVLSLAGRVGERGPGPVGIGAVLVVSAGAAVLVPAGLYAAGPARAVSRGLAAVAALVALGYLWPRRAPHRTRVRTQAIAGVTAVAMVAASAAMVVASPRPRIDVWAMYQASARALLHGHNPYLAHWTSGLAGEVSNLFTYLPGSAVLLTPAYALFGDVRYGLIAALVVTAWFAYRLGGERGAFAASAVLLFPGGTFATEQAWNDPLLMALVAGTVYATRRGRSGWAVAGLAAALTCKQYALLLVPLAAVWRPFGWRRALQATGAAAAFVAPWALGAPRAFVHGVVRYNLDLPPRHDSLSLYASGLRHGFVAGMVPVGVVTLGAVLLVAYAVWRRPALFLAGAGAVMAVFDLVNKQSFFNEWELAAVLLILGAVSSVELEAAVSPGPRSPRRPHPRRQTGGVAVPTSGP